VGDHAYRESRGERDDAGAEARPSAQSMYRSPKLLAHSVPVHLYPLTAFTTWHYSCSHFSCTSFNFHLFLVKFITQMGSGRL